MKALSLTRPWTELVMSGEKTVENRTWRTPYRGLLVVHAARSWDPQARQLFDKLVGLEPDDADRYCPRDRQTTPVGYLGVVTLIDCHPAGSAECQPFADWCPMCSPWSFDGQWHWVITGARRFPQPIPGGGRLGLFDPPPDVASAASRLRLAVTN